MLYISAHRVVAADLTCLKVEDKIYKLLDTLSGTYGLNEVY